jgi:hypothetical protein
LEAAADVVEARAKAETEALLAGSMLHAPASRSPGGTDRICFLN